MAKIVLSLDGRIIDQRFLSDEPIVIGRDAACDLVVPSAAVSQRHASISAVVNDHFIEDLGSTNGTVVNGRPVTRHLLQNGDVVFLGDYRLKYVSTATAGLGLDRTLLLDPDVAGGLGNAAAVDARGLALDTASAAAHAARARLAQCSVRGIDGRYAGQDFDVERILLPVGQRGLGLAVINRRPTGCFLVHVGGTSRARINGRPVGDEPMLLVDGDVIEAGPDKLVFNPD